MRVLVTGGAGFIGSHIVQQALEAGLEPAVLDDFSTGKAERVPPGVRVFRVDLRDREATFEALAEFSPHAVCHQAAQVSVPVSMKQPHLDAQINVLGGLNLLDACAAVGARRFVFASTGGAIYGEVPEGRSAREDFTPDPKSPYGIDKLCFEKMLTIYRETRGIEAKVLRYANVYGPAQDPHGEAGVVAIFFDAAHSGAPLRVCGRSKTGDAGGVRDYVFVRDVARANVAALLGQVEPPVVNVASGTATTTRDLAHAITALVGSQSPIESVAPRAGDVQRSLLDCSLMTRLLGAPTPLAVGLDETAAWYRAH
jgi:UDP-glucose 4-epimerase